MLYGQNAPPPKEEQAPKLGKKEQALAARTSPTAARRWAS
jgi:hypothetical protein